MEAVHEACRGVNVSQRLDIQRRVQDESPVALTAADACGESQRLVASFQVRGAEAKGLPGPNLECDRSEAKPRIVNGRDRHLAGFVGVVDNANHPFAQGIGCRWQQGKTVGVCLGKEWHEEEENRQGVGACVPKSRH